MAGRGTCGDKYTAWPGPGVAGHRWPEVAGGWWAEVAEVATTATCQVGDEVAVVRIGRRGHADEVARTTSSGGGPDRATRSRGGRRGAAVRCHLGGYRAGRLSAE